jgi:hypothetical protein
MSFDQETRIPAKRSPFDEKADIVKYIDFAQDAIAAPKLGLMPVYSPVALLVTTETMPETNDKRNYSSDMHCVRCAPLALFLVP